MMATGRNTYSYVMIFVAAVCAISCCPQAKAAQQCEGQTPEHHSLQPPFDTNSHLEYGDHSYAGCFSKNSKMQKGGEFWRIDRCVYNPDTKYDLKISWLVPEWEGYVPPQCAVEYPHYLNADDPKTKPKTNLIKSCIEYGNAGRMTTAQYIGDEQEKEAASHEDQSNCRLPVARVSGAGADPDPRSIDFDIELFFLSDASRAQQTMLAMEAHYKLDPGPDFVTAGKVISRIQYELAPARQGSEGNPTARPRSMASSSWYAGFPRPFGEAGCSGADPALCTHATTFLGRLAPASLPVVKC
jgi:hypothetical protein